MALGEGGRRNPASALRPIVINWPAIYRKYWRFRTGGRGNQGYFAPAHLIASKSGCGNCRAAIEGAGLQDSARTASEGLVRITVHTAAVPLLLYSLAPGCTLVLHKQLLPRAAGVLLMDRQQSII